MRQEPPFVRDPTTPECLLTKFNPARNTPSLRLVKREKAFAALSGLCDRSTASAAEL
jgi:hypothetical protein